MGPGLGRRVYGHPAPRVQLPAQLVPNMAKHELVGSTELFPNSRFSDEASKGYASDAFQHATKRFQHRMRGLKSAVGGTVQTQQQHDRVALTTLRGVANQP